MSRIVFNMLTLLIFSGIAISLFAQAVILPGIAADEVRHFPPYAPYRAPLLAAGIAFIASAQVSLAALWALVFRAQTGTFFRPGTQRWVITIGAAVGVATLLTSGFFLYLTFVGIPTPDDGMGELGLWMASGLGCLVGVALLGVVFVTHRLVERATEAQTELDGVL
jgi:small-conductance mechanosensitive channel